ncbi:hypothetical protein SUDANB148_01631 [Streptomyces sp. SudanB148_2056]
MGTPPRPAAGSRAAWGGTGGRGRPLSQRARLEPRPRRRPVRRDPPPTADRRGLVAQCPAPPKGHPAPAGRGQSCRLGRHGRARAAPVAARPLGAAPATATRPPRPAAADCRPSQAGRAVPRAPEGAPRPSRLRPGRPSGPESARPTQPAGSRAAGAMGVPHSSGVESGGGWAQAAPLQPASIGPAPLTATRLPRLLSAACGPSRAGRAVPRAPEGAPRPGRPRAVAPPGAMGVLPLGRTESMEG